MTDKTYCAYVNCPLKKCDRHLSRLQNKSKTEYVSICDFAPICEKYLRYVLEELEITSDRNRLIDKQRKDDGKNG